MKHTNRRTSFALAGVVAMLIALPGTVLADEADDLAAAEAGTSAFVDVAAAEAAGYALPTEGPLHECIASFDDTGAMGLHFLNGELVGDTEVDAAKPEALVYAPTADGGLELVAVEYVVFAEGWDAVSSEAPVLFGQTFHLTGEPNRYEIPAFYALHVWLYRENESGMYADFNPDVTCNPMPDTATTDSAVAAAVDWVPIGAAGVAVLLAAFAGLAFTRVASARQRPS